MRLDARRGATLTLWWCAASHHVALPRVPCAASPPLNPWARPCFFAFQFIALQDGTRLPIYPFHLDGTEEIVELDASDVFIGRGDLIHYGPEYTGLNVRIHAHLDSMAAPEARRHGNTYPITDDNPTAHWPI
jgi:hypothetical protein